jgi:hypothetical protein
MIPKGAKVKIKDSEIESFRIDFQRRVCGRIGIVRGHMRSMTNNPIPLVEFPKEGRRHYFDAGGIREQWLDVVELPNDAEAA